ncbi:class II aldolase/adducin family protein [Paenactinomyces guangxiensis]|uniref:Class II aldolase/adducin family protein n=1 Tax=Paenactinomyces guangxiensis TaxID=1490290 RepID=A0A7W2A9K6_9BACL|nr:class II aldolase/adducin family protein [Paenactinomyces guangxiensis]MBA4494973.1 class II aldolase/adducin family protein [Paenactinomyces guangxiensis]MBH8592056.1 class II aldolase/adducin family protein [Paenactinomyces guangxiensis]
MITFCMVGNLQRTPGLERFASGIQREMEANGYQLDSEANPDIQLVFNFVDPVNPHHFPRKGKGTFVVTVTENNQPAQSILRTGYPILIRSLGNMMIYIDRSSDQAETFFVTLEQGCYSVPLHEEDDGYFKYVIERLRPLVTSRLVIDNTFIPDLPEGLWEGDEVTQSIYRAGKKLDKMNLLPTPFPIAELLSPKEYRHIQRLYGIGGLSYGNLSARQRDNQFWMSASGVNKANLREIGRDILLIKGFDDEGPAMEISVPPHVQPKRASVDAIEHWMIYNEHPEVGAIVHIHAWMDGIPSTEINYPCGTVQLAEAVAEQIRKAENPSRAVVGLKNHGLTITGRDLDDIFERIEGRIIPQVPMS